MAGSTAGTSPLQPSAIDHHCHGLVTADLERDAFELLLTEAAGPGPLATTLFDSGLGLAVRRWCAPVLDLEKHADPDTYVERRRALGAEEVNTRFLQAAGLRDLLVDTGFGVGRVTDPTRTAAYGDAHGHEIVRLESVAEDLASTGIRPVDLPDRIVEEITGRGAVGAKSVAAYRVGLALSAEKPSIDAFVTAMRNLPPAADGKPRIADPVVHAWLAHTAVQQGMPLQFHVGYGDADIDLAACDPLRLTGFLRATADRQVPVLLLHNYPFHRHAGYLSQVFPHVFMDVGLATHNTGALSTNVIAETLEMVPFGKLLYSSDAFGLSEFYYLGSVLFRRGLAESFGRLVDADEMTSLDAQRMTAMVLVDNARRVYGIA